MEKALKTKNGFTGVDIAVAVTVLFIFTSIISTIFINIYWQNIETQRSAVAMSYATQIAELADKISFQEVDNLNEIVSEMNINDSYRIDILVTGYPYTAYTYSVATRPLKIIRIQVFYFVGNKENSISIQRIKTREFYICPNAPLVLNGMVPVKYVKTATDGYGFWQITSETDSTWYSYNNKTWAIVMLEDGLKVEGNIVVTDDNKGNLVGKKVTNLGSIFAWIPRYAYNNTTNDLVFIYQDGEKIVNISGFLEDKNDNYTINDAFTGKTGFWAAVSNYSNLSFANANATLSQMTNDEITAITKLTGSKYGRNATEWTNLSSSRYVITVNNN